MGKMPEAQNFLIPPRILNVEHPFKEYNCSIEHVEQAKIRLIQKCLKLILEKKIQINFILLLGE